MKKLFILISLIGFWACTDSEESVVYTGNEQVFNLVQGSDFPISGTISIKERVDGQVELQIEVTGTEGEINHPTHLHFGDVSYPEAEVALLLSPVNGVTGASTTILAQLGNEQPMTYADFLTFNGHIKVHLDDGPGKDVILAAGNIGSAFTKSGNTGRQKISVCKSE